MNSRIRLFDKGSGRYESQTPVISSTGEAYTVSISKRMDDVLIYDHVGNVVGQWAGDGGPVAIMQAVKNYLETKSCTFAVDSTTRDSGSAALEDAIEDTFAFGNTPTSGATVLHYGASAVPSIAWNQLDSSDIQAALRTVSGLEKVVVTGSLASNFTVSMTEIDSPSTWTVNSNTLQIDNIQTITFSQTAQAGTLSIAYGGNNSTALDPTTATAADVQTALQALTGLTNATVTGDWTNGFAVTLVGVASPTSLSSHSNTMTDNVVQTVTFSATPDAGNFQLVYATNNTTNIASTAGANDVQAALRLLPGLSAATVTGTFMGGFAINCNTTLPTAITSTANTLTSSSTPVTITITPESTTATYASSRSRVATSITITQ